MFCVICIVHSSTCIDLYVSNNYFQILKEGDVMLFELSMFDLMFALCIDSMYD